MRAWFSKVNKTFILAASLLVMGCADMDIKSFADTEPRFVLEDYFQGRTRAWGIFEDRFGNLRRQFAVDIEGTWDGGALVLDERFDYADGERDRRVWRVRKTGPHVYEGTADDVVGSAKGESYGNALRWRYDIDLRIGEDKLRVHFDDWMFLQTGGVLVNRARVSKWGIGIGEVTLFFMKPDAVESSSLEIVSERRYGDERRRAAVR